MTDIKWAVFDLGGIVVPESKGLIDSSIADFMGVEVSQFLEYVNKYIHSVTVGDMALLDFYSILVDQLGLQISPERILNKHLSIFKAAAVHLDSDILNLIAVLKDKCHVGCLTNTEIEVAEINKTLGLFKYFEKAYLSTEIGIKKPDVDIYNYLLADIKCSPGEVVFIDDKPENVKSAESVGINAIQFVDINQLKKDLSEYCGEII